MSGRKESAVTEEANDEEKAVEAGAADSEDDEDDKERGEEKETNDEDEEDEHAIAKSESVVSFARWAAACVSESKRGRRKRQKQEQ